MKGNGPSARGAAPRQLALDLPLAPGMGREDFLVTPSNEAAYDAISRWPATPHDPHALALIGPPGSGRTHLAEIWRLEHDALKCVPADLTVEAVPTLLSRGALVLEDMPGRRVDETALFHLLNLPDLKSRLAAMPFVELAPPDDALLRAVLVKLFADRQLRVDEKVIAYLLPRMERSLSAARRLVAALDDAALEERRNITRQLAAKVLEEMHTTD